MNLGRIVHRLGIWQDRKQFGVQREGIRESATSRRWLYFAMKMVAQRVQLSSRMSGNTGPRPPHESALRGALVTREIQRRSGRLGARLRLVVVMQAIGELFPGDALAAAVADDHRAVGFVSPPCHGRIMARIGKRGKMTRVMWGGNQLTLVPAGTALRMTRPEKWTGWKTERRSSQVA